MVLRYHPREILFTQQASMAHSYEKGPLKSGIYFFPLKLKYELAFFGDFFLWYLQITTEFYDHLLHFMIFKITVILFI